ncbi:replication initiation protein [Morganella morganii]|uniref:replication initiation protein n=1 Tax=Morganella morganii TaxID=582 RepID=UPI0004681B2F|nr:replication initiation protein [Morganella morganii]
MSELIVYKANELAVSRYDLTEQETKLILYCIGCINPSLSGMSMEERTVEFSYQEYAKYMGISNDLAYKNLINSTRDLMNRSIELIYPIGDIERRIFNWAGLVEFNRKSQRVKLIFNEHLPPLLYQLKQFIKYNLEHVKAFKNKYSMRVYEWLLKEITQRKTNVANIEISISDFKFMLMLENNYNEYKLLNHWVLKPITKDLNTYSNMKINIEKRGRPADTLIFQVELDKQIDLVTELTKTQEPARKETTRSVITSPERLHGGLKKTLHDALTAQIQLTSFEAKFLSDMQSKYDLSGSFSWLTDKQRTTLEKILAKYGRN